MQFFVYLLQSGLKPLDIATGQFKSGQEAAMHEGEFGGILKLDVLFYYMKNIFLVIAVITLIVSFLSMLFINKSDVLAEKKEAVLHKLKIVFLASSLITLLNILTNILGTLF